jgi:hypothetical protein
MVASGNLASFGLPLAGGFQRGLLEQAFNQWPALPVSKGTAYSSRSVRFGLPNYMLLWLPVKLRVKAVDEKTNRCD